MRHSYFGKKLSRNTNERKNLIRNLLRSLILHGAIKTSKAKAQAVQGTMDKLITKAKKGSEAQIRAITAAFGDRLIAKKLVDMSTTRFAGRNSGYTRLIKLGVRQGDAGEIVSLQFVDEEVTQEVIKPEATVVAEKPKTEAKTAPKAKTVKKPVSTKKTK